MPAVKSDLIKELTDSYPSFFKKDLVKLFDIAIYEMQEALKRGERVEFRRNLGTFSTKTQKASTRRNPKRENRYM